MQQTGDQLRIIDGDGSVYSGYVRPDDATRRARAAKAEASAPPMASRTTKSALEEKAMDRLDSDRLTSQTYSFRVAGTNRSLNKKVVFTGNLLPATNVTLLPPATTNLNTWGGLGGGQNSPAQQILRPILNTRITGKVVIGSGKPVEINALPASP
jgi:hypothetical protein